MKDLGKGKRQQWVLLECTDSSLTKEEIEANWEPEFFDLVGPMAVGAAKGYDNGAGYWLLPTGATMSHKDNFASIYRHTAEACVGMKKVHDADIDPRLCAAWRLIASYTRDQRDIEHVEDK